MRRIGLKKDGTILLGATVSCDGFSCEREIRVQTHIHSDHMVDFNTSKANQTIVMSRPTRDLLCAIQNADLPYRDNILGIEYGKKHRMSGETIVIQPSHHMLGGAQVQVTCADGYRVGYSSDFFWPVEHPIEVDELIVDATYGSPGTRREYHQSAIDEKLCVIAAQSLRAGRQLVVLGHSGRLQSAMTLLGATVEAPIICGPTAHKPLDIYRAHGYPIPMALRADTNEAIRILRERRPCLAFATIHERRHLPWVDRMSKITLSAWHTSTSDPTIDYGNGDYCLAYTDHADFDGTLQYIAATGAQKVWTDPRTGNAEGLAIAVKQLLEIDAEVAPRIDSLAWG